MDKKSVPKPIKRSNLRRKLGKEYFCVKRKLEWFVHRKSYSINRDLQALPETLINHQSFLLKPLKDVDMYLQHNKTTKGKLSSFYL